MALPETLYQLRKQRGLSQEQLAEELGVSRQTISKWECGTAVPETEKLIAVSRFFGISLDQLAKESASKTPTAKSSAHGFGLLGIFLVGGGILGLGIWLAIVFGKPDAVGQLAQSSVITLDANAMLLIGCVILTVSGVLLWYKSRTKPK